MHTNHIKGNWKQFKGTVKQLWGEITFAPLEVAKGKNEIKSGQTQASNGIAMENARKRRFARERSKNGIDRFVGTPEIELYDSPGLRGFAGPISAVMHKNNGNL